MSRLQPILDALGTTLASAGRQLSVYPYSPHLVSVPAAIVQLPRSIDFDLTYGRGGDTYTLPVLILVGAADDKASQVNLAAYLDPSGTTSIKAAIEADRSLRGVVQDAYVRQVSGIGIYTVGAVDYLGATFEVEVIA